MPTVFVWLGVIMYLTTDAITGTLRTIAERDAPVWLAMDYLYPITESAQQTRADWHAGMGEPWQSFFTDVEMAAVLRTAGFDTVDDIAVRDLIAGYVGTAGSAPGGPTHLVRASRSVPTGRNPHGPAAR